MEGDGQPSLVRARRDEKRDGLSLAPAVEGRLKGDGYGRRGGGVGPFVHFHAYDSGEIFPAVCSQNGFLNGIRSFLDSRADQGHAGVKPEGISGIGISGMGCPSDHGNGQILPVLFIGNRVGDRMLLERGTCVRRKNGGKEVSRSGVFQREEER